ncbi:hypothetical protein ASG07_15535 [Sphingomonas sp. Leaf343]|nr:hypothetical protein ASG07_15535 [Sphingomonas sp. Leaf343]
MPRVIGDWRYMTASGLVLPPTDELSNRLYDQVLTRIYENRNGMQLALLIAYGSTQNTSLQLHRPENCYPAQGFELSEPQSVPIRLGGVAAEAREVRAERAGIVEHLLYWARIDRTFTVDGSEDRSAVIAANLKGYLPDGVLVRLSMPGTDAMASVAMLEDFNGRMIDALSDAGRHLLLGHMAQ